VRAAAAGELAAHWPEAKGLLPTGFGRVPDRSSVLELEHELEHGTDDPPDAPGELADAVTALRLATAAPVAAGPVLFERLDWRRSWAPATASSLPRCGSRSCSARLRRSGRRCSSGCGAAIPRWIPSAGRSSRS